MSLNVNSGLWARTALLWFLLTMIFGMYMGMSAQFQLAPSHAHMGVLGWISAGLFAFLYALAGPEPVRGARLHWAAHNLGLVAMAAGLFLTLRQGDGIYTPLIPIGGAVIILATFWLAASLWRRLGVAGQPG